MIATQSVFTKRRVPDYSDVEPLPDPPTPPDMMEQFPSIFAFVAALGTWFRHRGDTLVGSGGYLRRDAQDTGRFRPGRHIRRGSGKTPRGSSVATDT